MRPPRLLPALVLASTLLLSACATQPAGPSASAEADAPTDASFPVTIEHRLGTTTIDHRPERIVALGIPDADALIAAGIEPVAVLMSDEWPWERDRIDATRTEIMPYSADGPDMERIASLRPDLILATGLGGNDAHYATLSSIAPTLADLEGVLTTDWRDTAREIGRAVGAQEQIEGAIAEAEGAIAAARDHASIPAGTTYASGFVYQPGVFSADVSADMPQARLLADLGLTLAPASDAVHLDQGSESSAVGAGTVDLGYERLGALASVDVVIAGFLDETTGREFAQLGAVSSLPATAAGRTLILDRFGYTASSLLTVGSIDYALEAYEPLLATFGG